MSKNKLDHISDAIEAIKNGEIIIVVDDDNRENEGDFLAAAEKITPEMINFMATHGRGLICAPLTEKRCTELNLNRMVDNNTDPLETAFTVSVDLKGKGVTTGISASDRSKTIEALVNENTQPNELSRPGHIFPLIAKEGGVLRRTGHTEAAIDFARLAGFKPAGVIVEIMNEDGTMARLPQLLKVAEKFNLKLVSIEDLVSYRMQHDSLILKRADTEIQTRFGEFRLRAYQQTTNSQVHVALTKGTWNENEGVLTRINSSQINNDILGMLTGSNDGKNYLQSYLDDIFGLINKEGKGAVIFINQAQQSENLLARITELTEIQGQGEYHKVPPMKMDYKDFGIGAQILHDLRINKLKVITNSSQGPRVGITGYGLQIMEYVGY
ncbi:3,4-dihydroxy-2-butanone-4-phosphate synthase [Flavobacteriaceae bacterium]|uniref:3,4-dihydroxy-2-butanone-4-phosphate synthase n=1 Tax=Candidatus Arcticimaribacter forsetii TaxID=2820661 RepID=UPI002076FB4D|nr:3,4-dihydroxy-2-butanone-4-phosphate synthase [Candidatus Arcticimaribacter forsetii]MDB2325856.1 3,4-dihydroxy-2-butanone-4-phosphate synthase [Flavobacteriaceae bacterium]MDB2329390.1 3,4-dihydroxy-2-butanone-4-phosphate synthase [Flavobacteriaceae bacterium]MDB2345586.1 3,4-dihydroxy-2-butanone-4-phosphate synthase [Flavobacteriaceae bacterium]MDB4621178.1 3,4-dihydroxy-2-butanone-4-phosphate synthase [Flavobacteriaceae bacterium]MDB4716774.1 3,4-dihydroxy-2-butanone-4-phosphate synthase